MKNILLMSVLFLLFSCGTSKLKLYEKNMKTHKLLVNAINNYYENTDNSALDIDNYFTVDFKFYSFTAGSPKGVESNLKDYQDGILKLLKKKSISLRVGHSIYLPGIDENTYKIDGSVRVYYKVTVGRKKTVELSAYRTVNFEDGKISGIWEWADYGGLVNQLYEP